MPKKPADTKRKKISKAQQLTMLEVLGASLVLGTCLVLVNFILRYIDFNAQVISAKNDAIADYDQTIRAIGICPDKDNDKHLSDKELQECNPDEVELQDVVGSLRYNVMEVMAQDENLESVARARNESCYQNGERIDFNALYAAARDDDSRKLFQQGIKICSALRVIPDALPAQLNTEALMASLNQIFIESDWEPESLAPRDEKVVLEDYVGVEAIPVTLRLNGSGPTVIRILNNIDRSIRSFDINSATVEWTNTGISVQARANAFYLDTIWGLETDKTVKAGTKTNSNKKTSSKK